jgi:hypothetical protein
MDPAELLQNPGVELIYGRNGTFIFELEKSADFAALHR